MSAPISGWRLWLLVVHWVVFAAAYGFVVTGGVGPDLAVISQAFYIVVGTLILVRRPENRVGWILLVAGVGWTLVVASDIGAERLLDRGSVTAAGWVALLGAIANEPLLWVLNVALMVLFPDGAPASRRGARLMHASAWLAVATAAVAVFTEPVPIPPTEVAYPHPFLDDPLGVDVAFGPMSVGLFVAGFVAVGMLVARARGAGAVERRQIVVVAAGFVVSLALSLAGGMVLGFEDRSFLLLDFFANASLAGAIGLAVIRYRLFELGRLVRRSIVYAGLAVVIAAVYIAVVVFVGAYYGDGADVPLSVAATVAVALVFQPARRALERGAGRLVYGARAAPQEVLARFARRAAELPDDELLERIPELVAQGTAARRVALWIRTNEGFRIEAVWPADAPAFTVDASEHFDVPGVHRALPVFDDGELLGGLSVEKVSGEDITPAEYALLRDLAGALGVALRNVQLASALRSQIDALVDSRERLVTAADEARRDLEWRLDSGPLQRLVALKVKLGPVRTHAGRLGVPKVADLLANLETETDEAIRSVRGFAAGVHPPELASEGLGAAIRLHGHRTPFRLDVHDRLRPGGVERAAEVAVYFTVLEALQNAAKHAGATAVEVTLHSLDDALSFEVADDGVGFDPSSASVSAGLVGMRERVGRVGGRLDVHSGPGLGTRVVGYVPLVDSSHATSGSG
ncbi:MAG: hypothetical protein KDB21_00300 [Acidimicrobiales bacterium]|nr:hypothetical protein [Acidimicrobiales bacterium]